MPWYPEPVPMPLELTSQKPMGKCVRECDSNGWWYDKVFAYNATGGVLTPNAVYILTYDGDEETNPKIIACAAIANVPRMVCVATAATADATAGWVVVRGYYTASCNGTIAKDDYLAVKTGTDTDSFVVDTTAETTISAAIAREANTGVNNKLVFLIGELKIVTT